MKPHIQQTSNKNYRKLLNQFIRVIFFVVVGLSATISLALANEDFSSLSSPTITPANSSDLYSAAQAARLIRPWTIGDFTVGGQYDTLLGTIFNVHYAHQVNDHFAFGAIGEYGPNQYRVNGTLAHSLWENAQVKFSAEYLSQVLPFEFDSGDITQRLHQTAYGMELQQALHNTLFQYISLGGYHSQAPSVGLADVTFIQNDLYYTNQRHIAGSIAQGANIGINLKLTPKTALDFKLNYDDVNYNTDLTGDTSYNNSRFGFSTCLERILNDHIKLSLKNEQRALNDIYRGEISFAPKFASPLGAHFSLFAEHFVSTNSTPNSNSYGVEVALFSDEDRHSPNYALSDSHGLENLGNWVTTPAVYMNRVLAVSEQKTTLNAPTVAVLTPNNGPFVGGNTVTLTGSNFLPGVEVLFNGQASTINSVTPTSVSVIVPAYVSSGASTKAATTTPVDVVVKNTDGQQINLSQAYTYTTAYAPTLTGISPSSGSTTGGQTVTLTGTQLTNTTSVTFGGVNATSIINVNDTTVTAITPAHAAGTVDVSLTTNEGSTTSATAFTYEALPTITNISPTVGPTSGGTTITITGTNFVPGNTTVQFGSSPAISVNVISSTSLTATSPAGSVGTVDTTVTTPGGTSSTSSSDEFTYIGAPTITNVSPSSGPIFGGTSVTITGTNFATVSAVTFGGIAASYTVNSDTSIIAITPAHASGSVDVVVTNAVDSATDTNGYTYGGP